MPKSFSADAPDVSTSRARPADGSPVGVTDYPVVVASSTVATVVASAPAVEALERRELMSVSLDAGGWTVVTPGKGDRVIYVSSSGGDDGRNGTSPASAVETLEEGVGRLRDGSGDQLLLKAGDVWRESFGLFTRSGRSADEPLVIGSYGTGARPRIETGGSSHAFATGSDASREVRNVALLGLHFYSYKRDFDSRWFDPKAARSAPYGLKLMAASSDILVEDCRVEAYASNIVAEESKFGPIENVTVRRSVIVDAYSPTMHAQGIYADGVKGLTLEENVFDHNGWDDRVRGGRATIYTHNAYLNSGNDGVVVKGNVFANGGSHGLQMRAGGEVVDNFFYGNPLHLSFGLVNGATVKPGGVSGVVNGNVFVGTRDISGDARGMGVEIGNTAPGGGTVLSNNVFLNDAVVDAGQSDAPEPGKKHGENAAIMLVYGKNNRNGGEAVGINDLAVRDNVVYRWKAGLSVQEGVVPGGQGPQALNQVTVEGNDFQDIKGDAIVRHPGPMDGGQERWSRNRYDAGPADPVVQMGDAAVPLGAWSGGHEPDAQALRPAYVDPGRSLESYEKSLAAQPAASPGARSIVASGGGTSFFAGARGLSRRNWDARFTAAALIGHVRAGFEEQGAPPREWRLATPPRAAASAPQGLAAAGGALTFTVTYSDDKGVDVASVNSADVRLVREGGGGRAKVTAALESVEQAPDGSVAATYRVKAAPRVRRQKGAAFTAIVGEGQVRDVEGFTMPAGAVAQVTLGAADVPPPAVKRVKFRAKGPQALTVTFSGDVVAASLRPATLVLTGEEGTAPNAATFAVEYDAKTRSATWTFPAYPGGVLPEGKYAVSIRAADVVDAGGRTLAGGDFVWSKPLKIKR